MYLPSSYMQLLSRQGRGTVSDMGLGGLASRRVLARILLLALASVTCSLRHQYMPDL